MAYVKILAPLTGGARDATVLAAAFAAAKPFNAHVIALFVRPDPAEAMPFFGEGVSGAMAQEIVDAAKEAADKAAHDARAAIAITAGECGAVLTEKPEKLDSLSISFREVQGNFADRVARASRLSGGPDRACCAEKFRTAHRPWLGRQRRLRPGFAGRHALSCACRSDRLAHSAKAQHGMRILRRGHSISDAARAVRDRTHDRRGEPQCRRCPTGSRVTERRKSFGSWRLRP